MKRDSIIGKFLSESVLCKLTGDNFCDFGTDTRCSLVITVLILIAGYALLYWLVGSTIVVWTLAKSFPGIFDYNFSLMIEAMIGCAFAMTILVPLFVVGYIIKRVFTAYDLGRFCRNHPINWE